MTGEVENGEINLDKRYHKHIWNLGEELSYKAPSI
jgi:hypothetical protein